MNPYEQMPVGVTSVDRESYLEEDSLSRTTETVSLDSAGTTVRTTTWCRTLKDGRQVAEGRAARCVTCHAPTADPHPCTRCRFILCGRCTQTVRIDGITEEVCTPCRRRVILKALFRLC